VIVPASMSSMSTPTTAAAPPLHPVRIAIEGDDCYEVPLIGRGEGQTFVVETTVWDDLQTRGFPLAWTITGGNPGYVCSAARSVRTSDADLLPGTPRYLSRIITGAGDGHAVTFRNGNRRDLRRRNLSIRPREEVLDWPSKRGWRKPERAN
jgi:hypothetical protein